MFDVIVSGAGPAGSTAARFLAKQGYSVLLLDKAKFPSEKLCGGGLTPFVYRYLDLDVSSLIIKRYKKIKFCCSGKKGQEYNLRSLWFDMVDRKNFDDFLAKSAVKEGVVFHDEEAFESFKEFDDYVEVCTNKLTYQSRYLIGADGVYSKVAKHFGFKLNKKFFMMEADIAFKKDISTCDKETVFFDAGVIKGGCGWIFPKNDFATLGVCSYLLKGLEVKKALDKMIDLYKDLVDIDKVKYKGIYVPYYRYSNIKLATDRVVLIGDAARLMNPLTGEGISIAMRSATIAKDCIVRAGGGSVKFYDKVVRKEIKTNLFLSYLVLKLMTLVPRFWFNMVLRKGPSFLNYFLDPLRKKII